MRKGCCGGPLCHSTPLEKGWVETGLLAMLPEEMLNKGIPVPVLGAGWQDSGSWWCPAGSVRVPGSQGAGGQPCSSLTLQRRLRKTFH